MTNVNFYYYYYYYYHYHHHLPIFRAFNDFVDKYCLFGIS